MYIVYDVIEIWIKKKISFYGVKWVLVGEKSTDKSTNINLGRRQKLILDRRQKLILDRHPLYRKTWLVFEGLACLVWCIAVGVAVVAKIAMYVVEGEPSLF